MNSGRFNHLIEFNNSLSIISCEDAVQMLDSNISFDHSDIDDRRHSETNDIIMRFRADDKTLEDIENYLNDYGFRGWYTITNIC